MARTLDEEAIQAVAAYHAGLESSSLPAAHQPARPHQAADWLARRGHWSRDLPACNQCHSR